jgi:DNA replication and repair protein RecF
VHLQRLWLTDFRSYRSAELTFAPGLTAVVGANGEGKTNLLEAIAYLATLSSFRGAPPDALIREGAPQAVVRAEGTREGRNLLIEAELNRTGRNRVQVNRQRLTRSRDLLGALRVTVFSPDDLDLVKGGPSGRRAFLDDAVVAARPAHDALRTDVDRVLRQRNALLKQAGGRLSAEVAVTLDVWDAKLVEAGEALAAARGALLERLTPQLVLAYARVAQRPPVAGHGRQEDVTARYVADWRAEGLAAALAAARRDDVRRGVSTVGPHRDEVELRIGGMPARTHASQGEQRSLAWALRLATHAVVREATGSAPVLLLDDVFSELDPGRSGALLAHLPAGQAVLTTAGALPVDAAPEQVVEVRDGAVAGARVAG